MRKSRLSELQIGQVLKSVEAGRTVKEACREHGMSDATYYNWKSKYGGDVVNVSDLCSVVEFVVSMTILQILKGIRKV